MIVIVGGNKGGSSKTTTCCNLAVALAQQAGDVCVLDADRQGSAAKWNMEREESELTPSVTVVQKYGNLSQTLQSLEKKYTYVLVDVAGRNSREMITAATVADTMIAPHQCSQLDLDTLEELQEQIIRIRDLNPDLNVFIYQTMASTNPLVMHSERQDFEHYVSEFKDFVILKSVGRYRKIYRDVISEGKSVLESNNDQAKQEIIDLHREVLANG